MTMEEQIITLLEERLATITTGNGYNTNAGQSVYRGLEYTTAEQIRPALVVFPGENTTNSDEPCLISFQNHFLKIGVEGIIDDTERGAAGLLLRADLAKLLWQDSFYNNLTAGYEGGVTITAVVHNSGGDGFISLVSAEFTVVYSTAIGEI